jgi:hypothetical protein
VPLILPRAPQFSRYESNLAATPGTTSVGTNVTHYATTAHTKNPTWTELIASTAFDAQLIVVTISNNSVSNTNSSTLLDIGIGAAAAETAIIPDMAAGWVGSFTTAVRWNTFPLYIPAGSRLSARTQSIRQTGGVDVLVQLFGGPRNPDAWWCGQTVTTYGANAANSAGTKFTPGNSGAEGTGVSLGTTTSAHQCLTLGVQGHPDDATWGNVAYHLDVGFDSSSTEWVETDRYLAAASSAEQLGFMEPGWPIFRSVASGTELMVRGECSGTADALSAVIHGIS